MTVKSILLRLAAGAAFAALFAGVQANAGPLSTLRFEKGESPAADFTARGSAYSLALRSGEFIVALRPGKVGTGAARRPWHSPFQDPPAGRGAWLVSSQLVGVDREASAEGLEPMQSRAHYLLGADPAGWKTNVRHYGRVRYRDVYPGIDVEYYGNEGRLEYDFMLAPGADPNLIRVRFEGAESIEIDGNGDLVLRSGDKELRQHKPLIYQIADGERVGVEGRYTIGADRTVSIEIAAYDASHSLVIDPVVNWSRTFPGDGSDLFVDVAVDEHGFIYVAGTVGSTNLPHQDPLQPGHAGGFADAYVLKLAPDGQELIYATYLGGSAGDVSNGVAVDSEGSLYVSGGTDSPNFPTTPGAFQTGGAGDVDNFVVKLSPDGSSIVYSTLLGGPGRDFNEGLAIDDAGNAYILGRDNLGGFPTTPGALQSAHAGGWDAFAAKLNADGSELTWATYYGGSQGDFPVGIEVDDQHRAFLFGSSSSPNLPTTPDAFQRLSAGGSDLFLARLTEAGDALSYATRLGGSGDDFAGGFDLDPFGNVWMTGGTDSLDLPFAPGSEHPDFLGGPSDGFVVSLPLPEAVTFPVLPPAGLQEGGLRKGMTQTTWGGYLGDGNRNFGLAINVREAYGRGAVTLSLSNFVSGSGTVAGCGNETRSGTVGKLLQFDLLSMYRGGGAVCGNGVDHLALASNHQGDVVGVGFDEGEGGSKERGGLATSLDGSSFFSAPGETALEVKKTVTTDIPGIVGFKITVKNVGDEIAFNVRVVDTLPFQPLDDPAVGIGEPSRDAASSFLASMNILTIPLPAPLAPGESETITVALGTNEKGKFVNVAIASADNAGTAIAQAEFELLDPVNVTIRKSTSTDGLRFKSTITVTNEGETDASGLRVVDSFPTPSSNVSASADKGTCASGEVFRQVCSLPALPKGDTWTIMVDATAGLDLAKNAKNVAVLTVAQFNIGNEIAEALLEEGGGSSTPNGKVILNSRRLGGGRF